MRGILKQDHEMTRWDCTFVLPKGTQVELIRGASGTKGDLWAVRSTKLLMDLTGNTHDPKYRYCFVNEELVEPCSGKSKPLSS